MRKVLLVIAYLCFGAMSSIAQKLEITPYQVLRYEVKLAPDDEYAVAWYNYKALIYNHEEKLVLASFDFEQMVENISFGNQHVIIQTSSEGVLYDLKDMEYWRSDSLKGSSALFLPRDKGFYTASSNQHGKEFKSALEVVQQQSKPNSWLIEFDIDHSIVDSLPLQTVLPGEMVLDGNSLRITMKPYLRGSAAGGGGLFNKYYESYEFVDLKSRSNEIVREEAERKAQPDPNPFEMGIRWYGNRNTEVFYDLETATMIQAGAGVGKGRSEGGVVKVWRPFNLDYKGTIARRNSFNPLHGFNKEGDIIGELWVGADTLMGVDELAYSDMTYGVMGGPQSIKLKTVVDPETLELEFLTTDQLSRFEADNSRFTNYISEWSEPTRFEVEKAEIILDGLTMNFLIRSQSDPKKYVQYVVFDEDNWLAYNNEGFWYGTNLAARQCAFYRGKEKLEMAEIQELKNEKSLRESLYSIRVGKP